MGVLGHIYLKLEEDPDKAEKAWLSALKNGVLAANLELGKFYEFYKRDLQLAERFYIQARKCEPDEADERLRSLRMKIK